MLITYSKFTMLNVLVIKQDPGEIWMTITKKIIPGFKNV